MLNQIKKFLNWLWLPKTNLWVQAVIFIPFLIIIILHIIGISQGVGHDLIVQAKQTWVYLVLGILATFLVFVVSIKYFTNYYRLFKGDVGMDLLIAIGVHLSYFYSLILTIITLATPRKGYNVLEMYFWDVPSALLTFIGIGHYLEDKLKRKSSIGIKELLQLQNRFALLVQPDGSTKKVSTRSLKIGDQIIVPKGQNIPVDAVVLENTSELDMAFINGEPLPKTVEPGDYVISGANNITTSLKLQVQKTMGESTLTKIIDKLENIVDSSSKIQRLADRIVRYFIPAILSIALISFIIWTATIYSINNFPSYLAKVDGANNSGIYYGIKIGVTVVVIACPCAFGIAAPAAIYAASGLSSKNKILFASADVYEKLKNAKYIIFDKTGTLTQGKPTIQKVLGDQSYQNIAQSLASKSHHPLSQVIANYQSFNAVEITNEQEIPGYGIVANSNGKQYELGSYKKMLEKNFNDLVNIENFEPFSYVALAEDSKIVMIFALGDTLKADAKDMIAKFHELGLHVVIASGDNQEVVKKFASDLGIHTFYGQLQPEQKLELIEEFKKKGETIFVGDGLNDILAIKTASLGIAFASGSDLVNSAADISLMTNELQAVYQAIYLAKKTLKVIKFNFLWAFFFNLLAIPVAISGILFPWLAAIIMIISNILLLSNTLYFKNRTAKKLKEMSANNLSIESKD
ncbi:heavy metal translocating P-type ATPase [Mycoplasma sp. 5912]